MTCSIFMDSITASVAPRGTAAPASTVTDTMLPGSGEAIVVSLVVQVVVVDAAAAFDGR